jgi:phosphohistidine swiveling domain-containing protein
MASLWVRFPEEIVFARRFSEADRRRLEKIFAAEDPGSPWRRALALLSLKQEEPASALIAWRNDAPYFNWSEMVRTVSGGAMQAVKREEGGSGYGFRVNYSPAALWRLVKSSWTMTRFRTRPDAGGDAVAESVALGLVLQALVMRLGAQGGRLGEFLADPLSAPKQYRALLKQIQEVQMRRTELSPVWAEMFPAGGEVSASAAALPEFFWDDEKNIAVAPLPQLETLQETQAEWKGRAVCAGAVTGVAVFAGRGMTQEKLEELHARYQEPLVLLFAQARPETVELFPFASGLVFAEGGALSHACTVAREMNIPAVTAVGIGFLKQLEAAGEGLVRLTLDGATGRVALA